METLNSNRFVYNNVDSNLNKRFINFVLSHHRKNCREIFAEIKERLTHFDIFSKFLFIYKVPERWLTISNEKIKHWMIMETGGEGMSVIERLDDYSVENLISIVRSVCNAKPSRHGWSAGSPGWSPIS